MRPEAGGGGGGRSCCKGAGRTFRDFMPSGQLLRGSLKGFKQRNRII